MHGGTAMIHKAYEFDRPRLTFVVWDVICTLTVEARLVPVVVAKTSGKRGHQSQKNPGGLHALGSMVSVTQSGEMINVRDNHERAGVRDRWGRLFVFYSRWDHSLGGLDDCGTTCAEPCKGARCDDTYTGNF